MIRNCKTGLVSFRSLTLKAYIKFALGFGDVSRIVNRNSSFTKGLQTETLMKGYFLKISLFLSIKKYYRTE